MCFCVCLLIDCASLFSPLFLAIPTPLKNGTNASLSTGQGSGDAFNWTGSGPLWNESDPSPLPPSQTDDHLGQGKQGCREQSIHGVA